MIKKLLILLVLFEFTVGENCTTLGHSCSKDCKQHIHCPYGNNEEAIVLATCEEPKTYCSKDDSFKCTQEYCTVDLEDAPFFCSGEGVYPDPGDCSKYYLCENTEYPWIPSFKCQCAEGEYFDHTVPYCRPGRTDPECKTPNLCNSPMDCHSVIPYDNNPNLRFHYVCSDRYGNGNLYPIVFECASLLDSSTCKCNSTSQTSEPVLKPDHNSRAGTCEPYRTSHDMSL